MIKASYDCNKCIHKSVCKYWGNVTEYANNLRTTNYAKNVNWDDETNNHNTDIIIRCRNYEERLGGNFR